MKRGYAHVEILISFGIFVGLVVFILVYMSPIKKDDKSISEEIVIHLKNNFFEKAATNVTIFFLNSSEPCSPYELLNGTNKTIEENKHYITISPEIENVLANCSEIGTPFEIGSVKKRKVLSNSSLEKIKEQYYENYSSLKEDLLVKKDLNFEVISEYYELKREDSKENKNIIARTFKLEIIYSNGTIEKKDFIFKIW